MPTNVSEKELDALIVAALTDDADTLPATRRTTTASTPWTCPS